ncbi:Phosphatidate cytidylyltransferase [compost metagenome]
MKKNFTIRAISALVAVGVLIALYVFLKELGIKIAILASVIIGSYEIVKILFKEESSKFLKVLFYGLCVLVFVLSAMAISLAALAFSLALIALCISSLATLHKTADLQRIGNFQTKAALGLFYVGLLPSFSYRVLVAPNGLYWFVTLLLVVFAGDTFAYIFGVLFGKQKLMPNISPKKSLQGSIGGLVGSALAMWACQHFFFSEMSLVTLIPLAVIAGVFAQFGDFFESLLKRIADVKDSGRIMPGHGGILDRIDGVLFASPVILLGIILIEYFS